MGSLGPDLDQDVGPGWLLAASNVSVPAPWPQQETCSAGPPARGVPGLSPGFCALSAGARDPAGLRTWRCRATVGVSHTAVVAVTD